MIGVCRLGVVIVCSGVIVICFRLSVVLSWLVVRFSVLWVVMLLLLSVVVRLSVLVGVFNRLSLCSVLCMWERFSVFCVVLV